MSGFTFSSGAAPLRDAIWRPASGHPSGRWRVMRDKPGYTGRGSSMEEACGPSGKLRLFKTQAAAQRVADALNGKSSS